ncbi:MAG TPA: hypothetical protein VE862_00175 [Candidatus Acidoferrum sp.]|nr:hypothetical protein [Candidatus Acidoferrum sp.]
MFTPQELLEYDDEHVTGTIYDHVGELETGTDDEKLKHLIQIIAKLFDYEVEQLDVTMNSKEGLPDRINLMKIKAELMAKRDEIIQHITDNKPYYIDKIVSATPTKVVDTMDP